MKFKLDENFGSRSLVIFVTAGHDVETVRGEGLGGADDSIVFAACRKEGRCLVTLDRDFSDVTRFDPRLAGGIAVLRLPRNPSLALLEELIRQFLAALHANSIEKQLWIVEPGRIRLHQLFADD